MSPRQYASVVSRALVSPALVSPALVPVALVLPALLAGFLVFIPTTARAQQAVPTAIQPQINPGIVTNENRRNERQIREQTEQTLQGPAVVPVPVPQSQIAPAGGQTFLLKAVTFDTSAFLTKEQLDAIAAPYIGRKVDISEIQRIVKGVNDLYAEKGIVTAAATLPPQNLKDGLLKIALTEGKLGQIVIKGNTRTNDEYIRGQVRTQPGQVVDVPLLTREIAGFNKTGVAQVQASLGSGASFGLTDIQLAVIEPPALSVSLFGDNQGIESVGKYEGGFLIQGYAPLGVDDRLTVYGVGSRGNLDGNFAYSLPFDLSGGRVGASYTKGHIYVVQGPFVPLDIKGQSEVAALNATQPVFVNSNFFLLATGSLSRSISSSTQTDIPITDNQTFKETAGFSIGYQNEKFSASVSPTYSAAQTEFKVVDTQQHFSLYDGIFASSLRLPLEFVATLAGAFQVSSAQLISGDQLFQIGGPTTVRGYTTALAAGATGFYANLELHHNLGAAAPGADIFAFYDRGSVYSTSPTVVTLQSVGTGLSYNFKDRAIAEVSIGFPLDHVETNQPPCEAYFRLTTKFSSADLALLK